MRHQSENAILPRRGEVPSLPAGGAHAPSRRTRRPAILADSLYLNIAVAAGLLWLALRSV